MKKLVHIADISERLINVCNNYGFIYLSDLIEYGKKHNNEFTKLKNCGKRTAREINQLIINFHKHQMENSVDSKTHHVEANKKHHDVSITEFINFNGHKLSARAFNVLSKIRNNVEKGGIDLDQLTSEYYFKSLDNCGRKTAQELIAFFGDFHSFSNETENVAELSFLRSLLSNKKITSNELVNTFDYYGISNLYNLDIISIIDLVSRSMIKEKIRKIWSDVYVYNKHHTDVGTIVGLTKERVRQICKTIPKEALKVSKRLENSFKEFNYKFDYSPELNFVMPSKNKFELPSRFIYECLSHIYGFDIIHLNKNYNSSFLIKTTIAESFNIKNLLETIDYHTKSSLTEDRLINLSDLLEENLRSDSVEIRNYINVFSELFLKIYNVPTTEGFLVFLRNKKKKNFEHIAEVLRKEQRPMHIDDIRDVLIKEGLKKQNYKSENVRSHMLNHPSVFINTAWSTYGLKEWEIKMNLVGGTIKQLICRYLEQFDEPKHIYEISNYIMQHRKTNRNSVWGNINLDPQNNFNVYVGGFVGLSSQEYSLSQTNFNKVSNKWFSHFKKRYLERGKSSYKMQEVSKKLAFDLNVKPIQIRAQFNERIEKGQLYLCADDYLYIKTKSAKEEIDQLSDSNIQELVRNKETMSRLELISKCIELASINGKKISIKSAKAIIDSI